MARCAAFKPDGTPCERIVSESQTYCYAHDPRRAKERSKNAAIAGRGTASSREVAQLKGEVKDLIAEVREGKRERADAVAMLQGYRVLRDYLELERRIKETEDLERRVMELEGIL